MKHHCHGFAEKYLLYHYSYEEVSGTTSKEQNWEMGVVGVYMDNLLALTSELEMRTNFNLHTEIITFPWVLNQIYSGHRGYAVSLESQVDL